ncbi:MAG: hypothetical protein H6Q15_189 [Bacteroidetes bacterium]|nr:hypothetical protein [Bacteroidota bacterium]
MKTYKIRYIGDKTILGNHTIGFLCSRNISKEIEKSCNEWANDKVKNNQTVVCGNITKIEKEIVNVFLTANHRFILVLANGFKNNINDSIKNAIDNNKILVITPFEESVLSLSKETSEIRNKLIIKISKEIHIGDITKGGNLESLLENEIYSKIPIKIKSSKTKPSKKILPQINDNVLFEILRLWRLKTSKEEGIPPYVIFSQKALIEISNIKPKNMNELMKIYGVGEYNSKKYGSYIFDILKKYEVKG